MIGEREQQVCTILQEGHSTNGANGEEGGLWMGLDRVHCHHLGMKKQPILGWGLRNEVRGKLKTGLSSLGAMTRKMASISGRNEDQEGNLFEDIHREGQIR